MAIERIVETTLSDNDDDQQIEVTLRPQRFSEYMVEERLKKNLKLGVRTTKKAR